MLPLVLVGYCGLNILFLLALFILQLFTEAPNRNDLTVSMKQSWNGDTFKNISVFELPPSDGISRCVNFEFRYGMWSCFWRSAMMTLVSSLSDLLIFFVSSMRTLVFGLSEPAKSIRFIVLMVISCLALCSPYNRNCVTECERDERSLPAVAAVARLLLANSIKLCSSSLFCTSHSVRFDTNISVGLLALTIRMSKSFDSLLSKSNRTSL